MRRNNAQGGLEDEAVAQFITECRAVLGSAWGLLSESEDTPVEYDIENYGAENKRVERAVVAGTAVDDWCATYLLFRPRTVRDVSTSNTRVWFSADLQLGAIRDPRKAEVDLPVCFSTDLGGFHMDDDWVPKLHEVLQQACSYLPCMQIAVREYHRQIWGVPTVLPDRYQEYLVNRNEVAIRLQEDKMASSDLLSLAEIAFDSPSLTQSAYELVSRTANLFADMSLGRDDLTLCICEFVAAYQFVDKWPQFSRKEIARLSEMHQP